MDKRKFLVLTLLERSSLVGAQGITSAGVKLDFVVFFLTLITSWKFQEVPGVTTTVTIRFSLATLDFRGNVQTGGKLAR